MCRKTSAGNVLYLKSGDNKQTAGVIVRVFRNFLFFFFFGPYLAFLYPSLMAVTDARWLLTEDTSIFMVLR